jgi:hypothetical protein
MALEINDDEDLKTPTTYAVRVSIASEFYQLENPN